MGLAVGPWLGVFKKAILQRSPEAMPIDVVWTDPQKRQPSALPLGTLKNEILHVAAGRKIAYVVDCAYTDANADKVISLAMDADILFIEAAFLDEDKSRAADRRHLTARQAGMLAGLANVKRLVTFHHSPRYQGHADCLVRGRSGLQRPADWGGLIKIKSSGFQLRLRC